MRWMVYIVLLTCGSLLAPPGWALSEEQSEIKRNGDLLQVALPLIGLGMTFTFGGNEAPQASPALTPAAGHGLGWSTWPSLTDSPRHDLLVAMVRTEIATYGLKYSIEARRPNGGLHSFPSGHTAAAFTGAEFIRKEYGWWWGAPAYALASYVGWSRVATDAHWSHDVAAGAAIGILSNHDFAELSLPTGMLRIAPALLTPTEPDSPALAGSSLHAAPGISLTLRF